MSVLHDFKCRSIDGELVSVVCDSWVLKTDLVNVTWHSIRGVREESHNEVVSALIKDVKGLNSSAITTTSSYFYGKLIVRTTRLAMMVEELCFLYDSEG